MVLKYFTNDEFQNASPSCDILQCDAESLLRLDRCREVAGIPFRINSAYRSPAHEKKMGRDGRSAHTRGRAFDIRCVDSLSRWKIVHAAIVAGFTRIGIARSYIHLDDDVSLPSPRIWLY